MSGAKTQSQQVEQQQEQDLRRRNNTTAENAENKDKEDKKEDKKEILLIDQPTASRWRNWTIRGILSLTMIGLFAAIVYMGPMALTLMVILLQLKCFHEIISIGHYQWPKELPWFRSLSWYFLVAANYFFYGENFDYLLQANFAQRPAATNVIRYHRFISFCLYMTGFCTFVLSLKPGFYKFQFKQFAWTHLALLFVASASQLIIRSIYEGLMWFLLPSCLVICNDIMAYMFGFFFGRTPLISLSPKKTWEGFLGAFASTLVFSVAFTYFIIDRPFFYCPVVSLTLYQVDDAGCRTPTSFISREYEIPETFKPLATLLDYHSDRVMFRPIYIHALFLATFSSLIAPFGGFFASGLKRAFNIKDFDSLIPGHGGITDRFDCQFLMAIFSFVYYHSFVNVQDVQHLVAHIFALDQDHQLEVYDHLTRHLRTQGLIT